MSHECKPWTLPSNYVGAEWHGFYSSGFGRSRDSDCLEESNFQTALKSLEPLNTTLSVETHDIPGCLDDEPSVQVVCENHWAVGWVEWIAIHSSNIQAIAKAKELCGRANDYPVLDESDWSNREYEQANEVWKNCYSAKERIDYIRQHRSQFEFRDFADLLGCVRGKYFAGYASELIA